MARTAIFLTFAAAMLAAAAATEVRLTQISSFDRFAGDVEDATTTSTGCVSLGVSNSGYQFTPADANTVTPVCIDSCNENGCYTFSEGCGAGCDFCAEVSECTDRDGFKRCTELLSCPCVVGAYTCEPANVGVSIESVPEDSDARRLDLLTTGGYFAYFAQEDCTGTGFNMLACSAKDGDCKGLAPCTSSDGSCCKLVPTA
ncbi:hypothetical protein PTSG_03516 [Salpingoeca rosetta]|uniref:EGF-like domain-containing protein n=1 Tax=Salpingoeca rosetta (strain ATCC 50818 / BSB-021) TaxID=946362 RepID=F2U5U4_SALR5|nr:uncharacterized protein PTSG_03516 [Salpingoeca rosetta]EGD82885.1 hypothetical protein PTSG_03516 [Salpingoeca rosetta]|eukprot:XP_004995249.1 hypothetical protein PTSG_03516 [Salpingoeca rosetta]